MNFNNFLKFFIVSSHFSTKVLSTLAYITMTVEDAQTIDLHQIFLSHLAEKLH